MCSVSPLRCACINFPIFIQYLVLLYFYPREADSTSHVDSKDLNEEKEKVGGWIHSHKDPLCKNYQLQKRFAMRET